MKAMPHSPICLVLRHNQAKALTVVGSVLLGTLLVFLLFGTVRIAIHSPPSFDGAMNLQVASSIARDEGYRRTYASRPAFPHEIQTGAPYILPAAVVIKIWGIGLAQAQIVNIAYFVLLLVVTYTLVRSEAGHFLSLFAACAVAATPGILDYGFDGYGEIPSLVLGLASIWIFYRRPYSSSWIPAILAGLLMALAIITKTVMLIVAGSMGLCLLLDVVFTNVAQRKSRIRYVLVTTCSGATVLGLMEIWRAISLGSLHAWKQWWQVETRAIFQQAGIRAGFAPETDGITSKFLVHLRYLSHDYHVAAWATTLWLVLLSFAIAVTFLHSLRHLERKRVLALLISATVYMLWWLLITPTAKAWHRRIIDGMILADIGMIMFAVILPSLWREGEGGRGSRLLYPATALLSLLVLLLPAAWLIKGSRTLMSYPATNGADSFLATARQVRELPADAYIFGVGWYSAPRIGLFSERHILDFNDMPVMRLQPGRPVYFVKAYADSNDYLAFLRSTYNISWPKSDSPYGVIKVDSMTPRKLTQTGFPVERHLQAQTNYAYMLGFNDPEGANGRWLSDDNIILLKPQAGDLFELNVYALPTSSYRYKERPRIVVSFNGCTTPAQTVAPGVTRISFPIPPACHITPQQPVNVRIEVDNLLSAPLTVDPRALSVLAAELGFYPPAT